MRAVLDTNIFVSALALPGGQGEKAVLGAVEGRFDLVISKPLIREVLDVLARKFDHDPEQLARVAVFLADLGRVVRPRKTLRVLEDEPDNRILECARAGRADLIVTGDHAVLALGAWDGIRIVTLRAFLDLLEGTAG